MTAPLQGPSPRRLEAPPVRDLFCISDGNGAAVLDRTGSCLFWSPPGFDGPLRLARLLDWTRGGSVGLRPLLAGVPGSRWSVPGRVLEVTWGVRARLQVALGEDAQGGPAVLWLLTGRPGLRGRLELQDPTAGGGPGWRIGPRGAALPAGAVPDGPGGPLTLASSAPLHGPGHLLSVGPKGAALRLSLGSRAEAIAPAAAAEQIEGQRREFEDWRARVAGSPPTAAVLGRAPKWAGAALLAALATIHALQDRRTGLLVAAPLTSIPQWPASQRAWDYRYAWLRDNADAGVAMTLAGDLPGARRLARGLGGLLALGTGPVRRLCGGPLPQERFLDHLGGYRGAAVRIGNAAADQAQVDTLGEVCRFAHLLERAGGCPPELLERVPALAAAAAEGSKRPDHGIWEVRGAPRHYTHSKVLAWTALDRALDLAAKGRIPAIASRSWADARRRLEAEVAARATGPGSPLPMAFDDPAADSGTLAGYVVGYPLPGGAGNAATLDFVLANLREGFLVARHRPERDQLPGPCLPFIFPSFWAALAEARVGRRREAVQRFRAIWELAGAAGQLSEVADPERRMLLGNCPQIQSHAALVEAAFAIWGGPAPGSGRPSPRGRTAARAARHPVVEIPARTGKGPAALPGPALD